LEASPHALDALAFAFTDTIQTHSITQDTTLRLDHVGEDAPTAQHHVVLIDVQQGATLTLIENISGKGAHWLNIASRLHIAKGARVEHILLQNASRAATLTSTQIVDVEGEYSQTILALGGAIARHECHVHLRERHASATLTGAYLGTDAQVLDHYLPITHHAQNCESKQTYKGVLDGRARGIFYGKIIVPPGASGTVAHQQSRAMLLSPQAEADNRPELEILNDDLVCSHGAAIGSLDPEMLYYLQARGLPEAQARALLIHAFVAELFDAENPLHQPLLEAI
jgi:Fe-S cluster assembly protein SufD